MAVLRLVAKSEHMNVVTFAFLITIIGAAQAQ